MPLRPYSRQEKTQQTELYFTLEVEGCASNSSIISYSVWELFDYITYFVIYS